MGAKEKRRRILKRESISNGIGFVACYNGEEIAFAKDFGVLIEKALVKERMGREGLVIRHNVPEGIVAVY